MVELVSDSIGRMAESDFVYADNAPASVDQWHDFTYLSRGALLANCCTAALKLAGHTEELQQAAFDYGKHLAHAHQVQPLP